MIERRPRRRARRRRVGHADLRQHVREPLRPGVNHTDNIQFEGGSQIRVANNYVYEAQNCATQGITAYDGNTNGLMIDDNVVDVPRDWGSSCTPTRQHVLHNTVVCAPQHLLEFNTPTGRIDIDRKSQDPAGRAPRSTTTSRPRRLRQRLDRHREEQRQRPRAVYVGPTNTYAGFKLASNPRSASRRPPTASTRASGSRWHRMLRRQRPPPARARPPRAPGATAARAGPSGPPPAWLSRASASRRPRFTRLADASGPQPAPRTRDSDHVPPVAPCHGQDLDRPRYDLLIVDEYQDLNACDLELLHLIAERGIVIAAGDDDQSIYSFRRRRAGRDPTVP